VLWSRENVQAACLYQTNGNRLGMYARPDYKGACPAPQGEQIREVGGAIEVSHPIYLRGAHVGALTLRYDLAEIPERIRVYGLAVLVALLLSSAIALVFSSRLRALIAEPILELARAANSVAQTRDYTIRARKLSNDEVGEMADALNQMLEGIQSRDRDLREAITAQRQTMNQLTTLNADLNRSNTELARSNQDLERFAFIASHDLQEPLRMITTYSQLLVAERPENPHEVQYVGHIVSGTKRMRELLSDLLSYTEVAGASEQPAAAVDLNAVLSHVQETLRARISETGAEIDVLPLPTVHAHENRMFSLFLNLIGNALKYRSAAAPHIRVWSEDSGEEMTFVVSDNGVGIAPEYHERIFEAFKRLHGRDIPGTGIGLAICQRIVERYGGRIWVESESGAGSLFRFTLPKHPDGQTG
jgi:signal transduction histidine kinase